MRTGLRGFAALTAMLLVTGAIVRADTVPPGAAPAGGPTGCPRYPAPSVVQSQSIYADSRGSVVDAQRLQRNLALIAPLSEQGPKLTRSGQRDRSAAAGDGQRPEQPDLEIFHALFHAGYHGPRLSS